MIKKPAAITCRGYEAAILSRKCWSVNFYMHRASVINFMIKHYPVNPTLFSPNTKPSYLFMAVSGMDIKNADILVKHNSRGGN
jgi:hypothetical protein